MSETKGPTVRQYEWRLFGSSHTPHRISSSFLLQEFLLAHLQPCLLYFSFLLPLWFHKLPPSSGSEVWCVAMNRQATWSWLTACVP